MGTSKLNANIAVLGAGVSGLCCAYALQKSGADVALYDGDGFPARNASFIAGGMLAPYSEIEHMGMAWVQAGLISTAMWGGISEDLGGDIEFSQAGSLLISHARDRHMLDRFVAHLPEHAKTLCRAGEVENDIGHHFDHSILIKDEGHLHPQKTMQALCDYLASRVNMKNEFKTVDELRGAYDHVIDCTGMASAVEGQKLRGVKGETALVRNPEFSLARPVRIMHPRYPLYVVPRANHVFMIGATVIESAASAAVSVKSSMELMSALYMLHPSFGEAEIIEFQAGIRPSYADNLPRISQRNGVISVNGMFRHGYLFAPLIAESVVEYLNEPVENAGDTDDILLNAIHNGFGNDTDLNYA